MATRRVLVLALGVAFSSPAFLPTPAARAAEEEGNVREQGQVDNANFKFKGKTKSTAFVRSGPSNNFYATQKLDKDAAVTVVGIKYEWLKIVPPPGSFSYVPKAYVERRGDGKVGRVTNTLNVRAGSSENMIKTTVQTKLVEGQDVTIIGDQDEYYKIVPPEGAYLFIHQQYVQPDGPGTPAKRGESAAADPKAAPDAAGGETARADDEPATGDAGEAPAPGDETVEAVPGTQPAGATAEARTDAPAAKPAAALALEEFRKLEAEFEAAGRQPVIEQPLDRLTEGYTKLVGEGNLTGKTKRMAEARLMALGMRADAREQLLAFQKSRAEMLDRTRELEAERAEIKERLAQTEVTLYSAVGVLRVSSLQHGPTTLYRLTDPSTGRTVVYLRSNDRQLPALLNQFVGVKGEVVNDTRLKMRTITPTATEAVDQSKVNKSVIATITPPSMVMIAGGSDAGEPAVAE